MQIQDLWQHQNVGNKRSGQSQEWQTKKKNRKEEDPELEAKPRITLQTHSITKEISNDFSQQKQVTVLSLHEGATIFKPDKLINKRRRNSHNFKM